MDYYFVAEQTLLGQTIMNTFWYVSESELNNSELDTMATRIATGWGEGLASRLTPGWRLDRITYRRTDIAGQPTIEASVGGLPIVGEQAAEAMPANCAIIARFGGNTVRPNRRRVYLGGLCETDWSGATWSSTLTTEVAAWGVDVFNAGDELGSPVYFAVCRWAADNLTTVARNPVTWRGVAPYVGSQRGRRF